MLKIMAKRKVLVSCHRYPIVIRPILRVVSNSQLQCKQLTKRIMEKSGVSASVSSVRRVLLSCKRVKRPKLRKKPSLTGKHKVERLRFAKERVRWKKKRRMILFSDEERFNLDGPDGLQYYFRDTRKETISAIRRQMGGGSVMVWAGIGYFGKTSIKFVIGRLNNDLITSFDKKMHLYAHQDWSNRILMKIMYLNIIENCWAELAHGEWKAVSTRTRIKKNAIVREWDTLSKNYIQKLYKSKIKGDVPIIK